MRTLVSCLVVLQAALFCREQQPCLRALIVQDMSTPDVQIASAADVDRVKQAFAFIADQTGLSFKPTVLKAHHLSKRTFRMWLKTIHSSSKEVALVYYSGQGANTHNSKWPSIGFGKRSSISESVIAKQIRSRKPKLGLIIFDCYRRCVDSQKKINLSRVRDLDRLSLGSLPGLRGLFRKTRGIIMGCSNYDAGQAFYSTKAPCIGGLFTIGFVRGVFLHGCKQGYGWSHINYYLRSLASEACIPRPFFKFQKCHSEDNVVCIR